MVFLRCQMLSDGVRKVSDGFRKVADDLRKVSHGTWWQEGVYYSNLFPLQLQLCLLSRKHPKFRCHSKKTGGTMTLH